MKQKFLLILTLLTLFSLTSCQKQKNDFEKIHQEKSVNESQAPKDNITKNNEEEKTFTECETLKVIISYKHNSILWAVVENIGNKPILEFEFAYISFDSNGFSTITNPKGYETIFDSASNIIPGGKIAAGDLVAREDDKYSVATVTYVKYADGSEWQAENIDIWAEQARSTFTITDYMESIEAFASSAALAETNQYIMIEDLSVESKSKSKYFNFTLTNIGTSNILKTSIFLLQYNKNGTAVSVYPYDFRCLNGFSVDSILGLAPGDSSSEEGYLEEETTKLKAIVQEIEFVDGTIWKNPYFYEWMLYNTRYYRE